MSRTVDLWAHLPPFLKQFKELETLLDAEKPEFQHLADDLERLKSRAFILTTDEEGMQRYEALLGILPSSTDTLESRRAVVLSRWYDAVPFTIRTLKNRIAVIQGNDDIQVTFAEDNPYLIQITTRLEGAGQVESLAYILQTMLPANLLVSSDNRIEGTFTVNLNYGVGAAVAGSLFLTNDLHGDIVNTVPVNVGAGASVTGMFFFDG